MGIGEGLVVEAIKYAGNKAKDSISDEPYEALASSWERNFKETDISKTDLHNLLASEELQKEVENFEETGDFDRTVLAEKIEKLSEDYDINIRDGDEIAKVILKEARKDLPSEVQQKVQIELLHRIHENIEVTDSSKKIAIKDEINFEKSEKVYANFFRVIDLPFRIKSAKTGFRKKRNVYSEYGDSIPPFILRDGRLYTFSDIKENTLLEKATKGDCKREKVGNWKEHTDKKYYLLSLLNSYLSTRFYDLDAIKHKDDSNKHTYFIPVEKENTKIEATWNPGRKSTRWVSKPLGDNYVHKAIKARFSYVDDEVYLILSPKQVYTEDGYNDVAQKLKNKLSSKAQSYQWNKHYADNVKFWSFFLSEGNDIINLGPIDVYGTPETYTMSASREGDYYGDSYYEKSSKIYLEDVEVEDQDERE